MELWRALHPPLLRYLTAGRNDSPEDVASETWLQVIRGMDKFSGDSRDFRAFLFTVARNRAIDAGRARAARPVTLVAEPVELHAVPSVPSAESSAMDQVSTEDALRLVATLPADQSELIMLRVVAGLDVAQVAEIVGKQPGTVRVGVHRALRTLRGRIPEQRTSSDDQHEEVS